MAKQENIEVDGVVVEDLSNSIFNCELDNGFVIKCTISGKIRINNVRILIGDKVRLALSPYDMTMGRIIYRYRAGETYVPSTDNNNNKKKKKR